MLKTGFVCSEAPPYRSLIAAGSELGSAVSLTWDSLRDGACCVGADAPVNGLLSSPAEVLGLWWWGFATPVGSMDLTCSLVEGRSGSSSRSPRRISSSFRFCTSALVTTGTEVVAPLALQPLVGILPSNIRSCFARNCVLAMKTSLWHRTEAPIEIGCFELLQARGLLC